MKKFVRRLILISLILLIFFYIKNSFLHESVADDYKNKTLITGIVKDAKNKKPMKNFELQIINGENVITTKTNKNGEYAINLENKKYTIQCNDNYKITDTKCKKYNKVDLNLELAFIYKDGVNANKISLFNYELTNKNASYKLIKKGPFINGTQLNNCFYDVYNNDFSLSPSTKNIINNFNNKCFSVIFIDKESDKKVYNSVIEKILGTSSDYKYTFVYNNDTISNILDKIYSQYKLEDSIKTENAQVKDGKIEDFEISDAISLDLNIEENEKPPEVKPEVPTGDLPSNEPKNFINGQVSIKKANNVKVTNFKNLEIYAKLVNTTNGRFKTVEVNKNGEYSFDYPGQGIYKIEIILNDPTKLDGTLNGQYYEFENGSDIDGVYDNSSWQYKANCMKYSNIQDIKNNFNADFFTNNEYEKQLNDLKDPNASEDLKDKVRLIGWTNEFGIYFSEDFMKQDNVINLINDKKIYADVSIKERDKNCITLEEKVRDYKIVLSNGQVFQEYGNKDPKQKDFYNITFEDKLRYGAKLFVEYEITVKNKSNIPGNCKVLGQFINLDYNKEDMLLTKNEQNAFDPIDKSIDEYIDENKMDYGKFYEADYQELYTKLYIDFGDIWLEANEEKTFNIVFTKMLDADDKNSCFFSSFSQIVSYKNSEGRRNYNKNLTDTCIAGKINNETDEDEPEAIVIIPPTGKNHIK